MGELLEQMLDGGPPSYKMSEIIAMYGDEVKAIQDNMPTWRDFISRLYGSDMTDEAIIRIILSTYKGEWMGIRDFFEWEIEQAGQLSGADYASFLDVYSSHNQGKRNKRLQYRAFQCHCGKEHVVYQEDGSYRIGSLRLDWLGENMEYGFPAHSIDTIEDSPVPGMARICGGGKTRLTRDRSWMHYDCADAVIFYNGRESKSGMSIVGDVKIAPNGIHNMCGSTIAVKHGRIVPLHDYAKSLFESGRILSVYEADCSHTEVETVDMASYGGIYYKR